MKRCKAATHTVPPESSEEGINVDQNANNDTDFDVNDIAPYSEFNLMSTNIWNDQAYDRFIDTLTLAEKIVLTPVHLQVIIVRLRTNHVPHSSHGAICFPLQNISQARCLPWFEFHELPFVVTTFKDKLGMIHEATIDMEKIRRAREFMTRKMKCPVYGTERYFYRF